MSLSCSDTVDSGGAIADSAAGGEIMLFGFRVKVDPMRKCMSLNNLVQYGQPQGSSNAPGVSGDGDGDGGYVSADEAVHDKASASRERRRGVPWTEEEHKLFLSGLQQVGKGDWRGIAKNFVKTRTPTQVASHAQKYFLRQSNINRRRRRTSVFDITTESVSMEEEKIHNERRTQPVLPLNQLSMPGSSNASGSEVLPFPVNAGLLILPVQIENPMEKLTLSQVDRVNLEAAKLICPVSVVRTANASSLPNFDLNEKHPSDPSLSLDLSLSSDQNQMAGGNSTFQAMSSFTNGDSIISTVA